MRCCHYQKPVTSGNSSSLQIEGIGIYLTPHSFNRVPSPNSIGLLVQIYYLQLHMIYIFGQAPKKKGRYRYQDHILSNISKFQNSAHVHSHPCRWHSLRGKSDKPVKIWNVDDLIACFCGTCVASQTGQPKHATWRHLATLDS